MYAPGLKTEKGKRDTAIMAVLMSAGNRTSALVNLKVSDIRGERVRIPPKCHHCGQTDYTGRSRLKGREEEMVLIDLKEKGGKSWSVPLHRKAAFYLNQYLVQREHGKNSDIVFPSLGSHILRADLCCRRTCSVLVRQLVLLGGGFGVGVVADHLA